MAIDRVAGVVLAGGLSRRLGRDKAIEIFDGEPLVHRVIGRLSEIVDEVVVVVNSRERADALPLPDGVNTVVDVYPDTGSLGGIFTGVSFVESEWSIAVACDMPFLNMDLLAHMLTLCPDRDVVVPVVEGRPEPTHAIYSKSCLEYIETRLRANDLKITRFFDDVRVQYVPQETIDLYDPSRISFFNVNTPTDLERALSLLAEEY